MQQRQLEGGGSVLVDENYIRTSISHPKRHVVLGYPNIMVAQSATEDHLRGYIALIKKLKDDPSFGEVTE